MLQKTSEYKDGRTDPDGLWEIPRPANDESRGHLVSVWVQLVLLGKGNSAWLLLTEWQKPSVQQTLASVPGTRKNGQTSKGHCA